MMKYEKYKKSEVLWLNQIPYQWEIKRVKDLGDYKSGEYINANEFDEGNLYPVYGGNSFRGFANKYNTEGDYVLIGRQGALCGNINYGSGKFWATEHCVVVFQKKKINVKWLGELLRVMNLNQYATSTAQPGLSVDKIKRLELPVPPIEEQTAIAQYLDTKTQAIDKKINLLTKKAETYKELRKSIINDAVCKGLDKNVKLKESGIEWIGKIPEHWEVKRLKTFAKTIKGKNLEFFEKPFEKSLPNLSLDYLRNDKVEFTNYCYTADKSQLVDENDLIIVWDGAGVGEILKGKKGFISSTTAKLVFDKTMYLKFFFHLRDSLEYTLKQIPTGMGIPHLNPQVLNNFPCPFPTKNEQIEIANYLDEKTQTIDAIVSNIGKQIDTLKELRKTLINDVVTGKIKVVV